MGKRKVKNYSAEFKQSSAKLAVESDESISETVTDEQTMEDFDDNLKNNLYRIWNRLSSGSYFPPPVRRIEIPKSNGKLRPLGIPTISGRIAQTVIKNRLGFDKWMQKKFSCIHFERYADDRVPRAQRRLHEAINVNEICV